MNNVILTFESYLPKIVLFKILLENCLRREDDNDDNDNDDDDNDGGEEEKEEEDQCYSCSRQRCSEKNM